MEEKEDYNYIIKIIQYLEERYKISFFICSADFDVLYGWWIKKIPFNIIFESIDNVVLRWEKKNKKIDGFKNFSYEVRKNFNGFMELKVSEPENKANDLKDDSKDKIELFINSLPPHLIPLKDCLIELEKEKDNFRKREILKDISLKLLEIYKDDSDLNLKTKKFLMNLNPKLRTEDMANKYKSNYIFSKHKFPEELLFFPDTDDIG